MPKEYIVSLIVEGDSSPAAELGLVVEQSAEHATHGHTQTSTEVV